MKDIFTIGYSVFQIDDFIKILKNYKINTLIDVRSNPNSQFHEDYNRNNIERLLKLHGIIYRNYKYEFGARQEDLKYYTDGYLDFNKYVKSNQFLEGLRKIEIGMNLNYKFVLMCAEKDPSTCHRNIMIAREFYKLGYNVKNILSDGTYETQESLENRLLENYFPNRNQLTLFSEQLSWQEMINKCYQYRNSEIGYKIENKTKVNIS